MIVGGLLATNNAKQFMGESRWPMLFDPLLQRVVPALYQSVINMALPASFDATLKGSASYHRDTNIPLTSWLAHDLINRMVAITSTFHRLLRWG
jgi:hypothetical protein